MTSSVNETFSIFGQDTKKRWLASQGKLIILWGLISLVSYFSGGIRGPGFSALIVVVVLASLWLSERIGLIFTGLSILTQLSMGYLEGTNILPRPPTIPTELTLVLQSLYLLSAGLLIYVFVGRLRSALTQAHQEIKAHHQTEAKLRQSENMLNLSQNLMHVGSWVWVIPTNDHVWSEEMLNIHGLTQDMIPQSVDEVKAYLHPDDREQVETAVSQIMAGKPPAPIEYRIIHPDKTVRTLLTEVRVERNKQDRPYRLYGAVLDITNRKQIEEELRYSQDRLQLAQQAARLGIWDWNIITGETTWWGEMFNIYGITPEEFSGNGTDYLNFIHPDDRAIQTHSIQQLFEQAAQQPNLKTNSDSVKNDPTLPPQPVRIIRPDNSICWAEGDAIAIADSAGQPVRMLGVLVDVTERKHAEEALKESEARFRSIVLNAPIPIMVHTLTGEVLELSRAFTEITGYSLAEIPTYKMWLKKGQGLSDEAATIQQAQQAERLEMGHLFPAQEVTIYTKSGQQHQWVLYTNTFQPLTDGQRYLTAMALDITERKQGEEKLRRLNTALEQRVTERTAELQEYITEVEQLNQGMLNLLEDLQITNRQLENTSHRLEATNQELESFSYSTSHDLRAPLRHIDGFVNLLRKRVEDQLDPTAIRYLNVITDSVGRMGQLIDALLAFSRMSRGQVQTHPVDMNQLVKEIQTELTSGLTDRYITWQIADLPVLQVDPTLMRQVIANLLSNAIKYTRPRPEAHIEIGVTESPNPSEITFFVQDNGVGFDMQYSAKLFGVFQRLHREEEFEGTGIGLATVRRIISRHNGHIWAESEVDKGATFYFTLPDNTTSGVRPRL